MPDLLGRDFTAAGPDVRWCGDITEIPTQEGKLYLATTLDLFSGRLLGHALDTHHDAPLVVASLRMSAAVRGGAVREVIFHPNQRANASADQNFDDFEIILGKVRLFTSPGRGHPQVLIIARSAQMSMPIMNIGKINRPAIRLAIHSPVVWFHNEHV